MMAVSIEIDRLERETGMADLLLLFAHTRRDRDLEPACASRDRMRASHAPRYALREDTRRIAADQPPVALELAMQERAGGDDAVVADLGAFEQRALRADPDPVADLDRP